MFEKILIANRGEIACRIMETARKMNIATAAVYSDADKAARHVRLADEAYHIGGAASADSYLRGDVIIETAKKAGAQAIHPGYGFLSENEDFARSCEKAGIVFIGPSADSISAMGLKDKAKSLMEEAGVPVVPGYRGDKQDPDFLKKEAKKIGYPVLIKAVAGGGGKGMRLVEDEKDFKEALKSCKREAKASFDNDHVLIEKYITSPRHVEVQVFGDSHGNAVHLYERDCSLQRRHQKIVEEAPAPGLKEDVRAEFGDAAVRAVRALGYENAGTIEFIMDSKTQDFFFMEMNTRLQVEHPVTEMVTGQDLVEWQIRIAAGEELPLSQEEITVSGHAFEARIYAEDAANDFLPQTGPVARLALTGQSAGRDIRLDTAVESGDRVTIHYDPMIAKLILHSHDRESALQAMSRALSDLALSGLKTNQEFLKNIVDHKAFQDGDVHTGFIDEHYDDLLPEDYAAPSAEDLALAAVYFLSGAANQPESRDISDLSSDLLSDPWSLNDNWRMNTILTRTVKVAWGAEVYEIEAECAGACYGLTIEGEEYGVEFKSCTDSSVSALFENRTVSALVTPLGSEAYAFARSGRSLKLSRHKSYAQGDEAGEGRVLAPMPGKIIDVMVGQGDEVEKDQPLLVMEAMKMEMTIRAGCNGVVEELPVATNDQVEDGALLVSIRGEDAA